MDPDSRPPVFFISQTFILFLVALTGETFGLQRGSSVAFAKLGGAFSARRPKTASAIAQGLF